MVKAAFIDRQLILQSSPVFTATDHVLILRGGQKQLVEIGLLSIDVSFIGLGFARYQTNPFRLLEMAFRVQVARWNLPVKELDLFYNGNLILLKPSIKAGQFAYQEMTASMEFITICNCLVSTWIEASGFSKFRYHRQRMSSQELRCVLDLLIRSLQITSIINRYLFWITVLKCWLILGIWRYAFQSSMTSEFIQ